MKEKLFKKDFTLIVIGQIISLFGNTILRFALSMIILDKTGSVAIFGTILAISMIPTILLSTFGGILADRANKRNIMVILDFVTAICITIFSIIFHFSNSIIIIAMLMVTLSIIQAFYQPSVQSSIPLLVDEKNLMGANGTVIQVNALANLLGPIIGGLLYGFFGIYPIIYVSAICFFLSAVMECFIKIPNIKSKNELGILKTIKSDFKEASNFLLHEQKELFKLLLLIAGINLFLSAMIIVGLPYIIKILLGLSNQLYGFAEAAMGIGSIIGGILAGVISKKIGFKQSYLLLICSGITIIPIGIAIILCGNQIASYAIIIISVLITMILTTLFSIYGQTTMQKLTPTNMLGKLSSVVTVICMCAVPIGQAVYGVVFDFAKMNSYLVIFVVSILTILIGFTSKKVIKKIKLDSDIERDNEIEKVLI